MNIDNILKKINKELFIFLAGSYFCEAVQAFFSSILITQALSNLLISVIFYFNKDDILKKMLFFCLVSLGLICITFINKLFVFFRTKKTVYFIENEAYQYFFEIQYYNNIKKDEIQAYITKSLIEYNSLYFSTISGIIRVVVTLFVSVGYSIYLNPYTIFVVLFMITLLILVLGRKFDKVPEIKKEISNYQNQLYRNLWEGIENLEVERFLDANKFFQHFNKNKDMLVKKRIEHNKIMVRADFLSQFGNMVSIILMVIFGIIYRGITLVSIQVILPSVMIVPNISGGIFAIPGLFSNKKNLAGMKYYLNSYFKFKKNSNIGEGKINKLKISYIEMYNISFSYNHIDKVLDYISLKFEKGKITTITGENGCGKSTLLKICAMLIPMDKGVLKIGSEVGENFTINEDNCYMEADREKYWEEIYFAGPVPPIIPGSLEKNVILNKPYNEEKFYYALEQACLVNYENRRIINKENISDGEAQKIAFARIFYHNYQVIFMDESTSHMDPKTEEKVMKAFVAYVEKNKIIVAAVSHKQSFLCYSDLTYRIDKGKIKMMKRKNK